MKVTYDPEADAAYIRFVEAVSSVRQLVVEEVFVLDFGTDDRLLGIEVIHASRYLRPETLEEIE